MALGLAIFAGFDYDVASAGDELGEVGVLNVRKVLAGKVRDRLPVCVPSDALVQIDEVQTHAKVMDHLEGTNFAFAQHHEENGGRLHTTGGRGFAHEAT